MGSPFRNRCLTADVSERPDSVELGALIARQLMEEADRLAVSQQSLHHRLEQERQRTLRYILYYTCMELFSMTPDIIYDGGTFLILESLNRTYQTSAHYAFVATP